MLFLVYLYFLWAELAAIIVNYWFRVGISHTFFWWSFTTGLSGRGEQPCCCSWSVFLFKTFESLIVRFTTGHRLQIACSCHFTHFLWKCASLFKWNNLWLNQHWWLSSEWWHQRVGYRVGVLPDHDHDSHFFHSQSAICPWKLLLVQCTCKGCWVPWQG